MDNLLINQDATAMIQAVQQGQITATELIESLLQRINQYNPQLNAFSAVTKQRALQKANAIDKLRTEGKPLPPLAGMPFAVKNLFDIEGLATLAGAKINQEHPPATADAFLIKQLEQAGAILLGALTMGEYAYDFTGENAHFGASLNPHDFSRMSGGSSGGSGTALGAGFVPISLASDTNGSIRVPSSFCGLYGLKPTFGRLSRSGTYPFVGSLDHLGPMARSPRDLAKVFDALQGIDSQDDAQTPQPKLDCEPELDKGIAGLNIATLTGYFQTGADLLVIQALQSVAHALSTTQTLDIPDIATARAAAYIMTCAEGAELHFSQIQSHPQDYDPDTRDRFIAGAMIPALWLQRAYKVRHYFRDKFLEIFKNTDVLLAPTTPCLAPKLGQKTLEFNGQTLPLRPNIGIYTQPISFVGLPVVNVPVWLPDSELPIGVQIITAPWREDIALRVAQFLDKAGITHSQVSQKIN